MCASTATSGPVSLLTSPATLLDLSDNGLAVLLTAEGMREIELLDLPVGAKVGDRVVAYGDGLTLYSEPPSVDRFAVEAVNALIGTLGSVLGLPRQDAIELIGEIIGLAPCD